MKATELKPEVRAALEDLQWDDGVCRITQQLPRPLYLEVDKALQAFGGKWDRKAKGHLFDTDAQGLIYSAVEAGEYTDPKKAFEFFETPPDLADRMVGLASLKEGQRILEPSAGKGAILEAIWRKGAWYAYNVSAVEICPALVAYLGKQNWISHEGDFLTFTADDRGRWDRALGTFDRVIMNPPFSRFQDIDHVLHAWDLLRPGGRLVSIMLGSWEWRSTAKTVAFRQWIDDVGAEVEHLPPGTFKASGTMVKSVLVTANKSNEQ